MAGCPTENERPIANKGTDLPANDDDGGGGREVGGEPVVAGVDAAPTQSSNHGPSRRRHNSSGWEPRRRFGPLAASEPVSAARPPVPAGR